MQKKTAMKNLTKAQRKQVEQIRQAIILALRFNGQDVSADSVAALTLNEIATPLAQLEQAADIQYTMDVFTR